jgi:hypothetical protein
MGDSSSDEEDDRKDKGSVKTTELDGSGEKLCKVMNLVIASGS